MGVLPLLPALATLVLRPSKLPVCACAAAGAVGDIAERGAGAMPAAAVGVAPRLPALALLLLRLKAWSAVCAAPGAAAPAMLPVSERRAPAAAGGGAGMDGGTGRAAACGAVAAPLL